jgi:hypothetical protein
VFDCWNGMFDTEIVAQFIILLRDHPQSVS